MRAISLTKLKAGISRIRTKGGASPEALFDLKNGYLTTAQTLQSRPGSVRRTAVGALAGTKGLHAFNGRYYVFGPAPQAVPDGFRLGILRHPTNPAATLSAVPFVGVIFGRLYVAATFTDGATFHFWLEGDFLPAWTPNTPHAYADRVVPTVPTGYVYQIINKDPAPAWTANTPFSDPANVQPRTYSGLHFKGTPSQSYPFVTGDTEPAWPTKLGATVTERRYSGTASASGATDSTPPDPTEYPQREPGGPKDSYI